MVYGFYQDYNIPIAFFNKTRKNQTINLRRANGMFGYCPFQGSTLRFNRTASATFSYCSFQGSTLRFDRTAAGTFSYCRQDSSNLNIFRNNLGTIASSVTAINTLQGTNDGYVEIEKIITSEMKGKTLVSGVITASDTNSISLSETYFPLEETINTLFVTGKSINNTAYLGSNDTSSLTVYDEYTQATAPSEVTGQVYQFTVNDAGSPSISFDVYTDSEQGKVVYQTPQTLSFTDLSAAGEQAVSTSSSYPNDEALKILYITPIVLELTAVNGSC